MTGRSISRWPYWRAVRWAALAAAVPALWACNAHRLEAPQATPTRTFNNVFQESINRDIDILFMIDDSLSMAPLVNKLADNFPVFMQVLQNLPGGLPNVHIAVVSQNLGAGQFSDIPQCPVGGDRGEFQDQVGAGAAASKTPCTSTGLNPGQHFIANVNGVANYDTTRGIASVFSCIANLGDGGCGFEHQIQSVVRALGADPNFPLPTKNVGFLRPQAYLAIIMLTNEDDDSAPPDSPLFDSNSQGIGDKYGPLQSYRANEFGHLCNGAPPPRTMAASFPPGACVSAEEKGLLIPVHTMVSELKALKADPGTILVAAITGPPDPYNVVMVPAQGNTPDARNGVMWPNIAHSCMQNSGEYGDPGIRNAQFINSFGHNGVLESICAPSFAPALQRIAEEIGRVLAPKCVEGRLADKDLKTPGVQPDCTVIDHSFSDSGTQIDSVVPACADNGGAMPCWALLDDAKNCPGAKVLSVSRPAGPVQSVLNSSVACSVCIPGVMDPRCP